MLEVSWRALEEDLERMWNGDGFGAVGEDRGRYMNPSEIVSQAHALFLEGFLFYGDFSFEIGLTTSGEQIQSFLMA